MVGFSELISAAESLYAQVETVKANRAQSARLATRVRLSLAHIQGVESLREGKQYALARQTLKALIRDAVTLTAKFQSGQYYEHFLYASTWKSDIARLHERLTDCLQSFNLGASLQNLVNQAADQAAVLEDMDDLRTQIKTVLNNTQYTRDQLVTIADTLTTLGGESHQHQRAFVQLAEQLKSTAQVAPTTEIVVAEGGSHIDDLNHQYIDTKLAVTAPEGISAAQKRESAEIVRDVFGDAPRRNIKLTVVQKDAHVKKVVSETVALLGSMTLTERQGARQTEATPPTPEGKQHAAGQWLMANHARFFPVVAAAAVGFGIATAIIKRPEPS